MSNKVDLALVYGAHPVIEVLKAKKRKLMAIYTTQPQPKAWRRVTPFLEGRPVKVKFVSRQVLDRMTNGADHMGIVGVVAPMAFRKEIFKPKHNPRVIVLDGVQDVGNLGAILRSAHCAGFSGVVLTRKGCAPVTPATIKASAGLAEHLDIHISSSVQFALSGLKAAGYKIFMAVPEGGVDVREVNAPTPFCLVIGNEEKGIKKDLFDKGQLVSLPQVSPDVSYNASVAAGILMFNLAYSRASTK